MITTNENNVWLIPSFSRNAVSTYRLQELVKDNFEINVRVKMDWKKINEYKFTNSGIVCLNGLHFGIICKVTDEGHTSISGETWTYHNGKQVQNVCNIEINQNDWKDWKNIKFTYKKDKYISIQTSEGRDLVELKGRLEDYSNSYLWLGCCDNHENQPNEYRGHWFGKINYLKIQGKGKPFAEFDFKKRTRYKVYDISENGNHLIKKHLNKENYIVVF